MGVYIMDCTDIKLIAVFITSINTKIDQYIVVLQSTVPCRGMLSQGAPVRVARPSIQRPAIRAS